MTVTDTRLSALVPRHIDTRGIVLPTGTEAEIEEALSVFREDNTPEMREYALDRAVAVDVDPDLSAACARRIHEKMFGINAALNAGDMTDDYRSGFRGRYVGDVGEKAAALWLHGALADAGIGAGAYSASSNGASDVTVTLPRLGLYLDTKTRPVSSLGTYSSDVLEGKLADARRRERNSDQTTIYIHVAYEFTTPEPDSVEASLGLDRQVTRAYVYGWNFAGDYENFGLARDTGSGRNWVVPWGVVRTPDEFIDDALTER